MAIAHLATEYVFSDFLLKEPSEPKFKGLRLELAVDKMVTCIAVGLPLLLISLAFAQEISIGKAGDWRGGAGRARPGRRQRCPSLMRSNFTVSLSVMGMGFVKESSPFCGPKHSLSTCFMCTPLWTLRVCLLLSFSVPCTLLIPTVPYCSCSTL